MANNREPSYQLPVKLDSDEENHSLLGPSALTNRPRSISTSDLPRPRAGGPPIYTIDLSLPPSERYVQVATDFKAELLNLTGLFDEVVEADLQIPLSVSSIKRIAKVFLRRVYSTEETEELRGIAKTVGVEMYLLVAFNVLLDIFMGCTSGGVKVSDEDGSGERMCHFRTLDWGMDALRKVVVQFEYVKRPKGEVVARSIGYVGFVGVLTGVR
jgi:hypothetical protein